MELKDLYPYLYSTYLKKPSFTDEVFSIGWALLKKNEIVLSKRVNIHSSGGKISLYIDETYPNKFFLALRQNSIDSLILCKKGEKEIKDKLVQIDSSFYLIKTSDSAFQTLFQNLLSYEYITLEKI